MRRLMQVVVATMCELALVGCALGNNPGDTDNSALSDVIAINAGGPVSGGFAADEDFTGASNTDSTSHAVDMSGVSNPAPQSVYQSERYGNFTYTIPGLTAGAPYTVRMHFAENYWTAAGLRIFNVSLNGSPVLSNFDIFATTGARFKAVVEQFDATASSSGQIVLAFSTVKDNAKIDGIEIQAAAATTTTLVNNRSGLCLGANGSNNGGATIEQLTCNGSSDQRFTLAAIGAFVQLVNMNSGLCLRPTGGGSSPNTTLVQDVCSRSDTSQQYTLQTVSAGVYDLVNNKSGLCVTDRQDLQTAGNPQEIYTCIQSDSQAFRVSVSQGAPANLRYSTNPLVATEGQAITADSPSTTGGAPTSYSVSPALPTGLSFNSSTGVISGTPSATSGQASYRVTAANSSGSTQANVSITVTSSGGGNYLSPFPAWDNALAWKTPINASKAAAHIKSYDAAAVSFYTHWNPGWTYFAGGVGGWNGGSVIVHDTEPGDGFYFASVNDPIYTYNCAPGGYCGFSTGVSNLHIPQSARTQNSGTGSCDCHLYVVQPVGWKPASTNGTVWPDVSPYQYEIDIWNAGTSASCVGSPSSSCTTFSGGGNIYGGGSALFSTGSTGWYGGQSSTNNGFSPGSPVPSNAPTSWGGSANHGNVPYSAMVISAQDLLQGAINHETALNMLCMTNSASDVWPSSNGGTDTDCSQRGIGGSAGTGWGYGDHIWLDRTPSQIQADVAAGVLTPVQGIYATSLATYGAVTMDTLGNYGPTFANYLTDGDPIWARVGAQYHLPQVTDYSGRPAYEINLALPMSYIRSYLHAIDSCVIRGTC